MLYHFKITALLKCCNNVCHLPRLELQPSGRFLIIIYHYGSMMLVVIVVAVLMIDFNLAIFPVSFDGQGVHNKDPTAWLDVA
jgi:hypothetical protein